jgi:hypothetical protein
MLWHGMTLKLEELSQRAKFAAAERTADIHAFDHPIQDQSVLVIAVITMRCKAHRVATAFAGHHARLSERSYLTTGRGTTQLVR